MFFARATTGALVLFVAVLATIDIRRGGWLDRVVQYQKEDFINSIKKIAPIKINAKIVEAPQGYQDSSRWDYDSVVHLLLLIKHSESAAPVHRALRRMLKPSRRLMMSMGESFKHFPSLTKQSLNEFYYDVGSAEDYPDEPQVVEKGVIVVTNPVEARLPSAQISIKLLQDILIARALAAREMPSTTKSTIPWIPMNKTNAIPDGDGDGNSTSAGGESGATAGGEADGEGGGTTAAGGAADGEPAGTAAGEPDGETKAAGDETEPPPAK